MLAVSTSQNADHTVFLLDKHQTEPLFLSMLNMLGHIIEFNPLLLIY